MKTSERISKIIFASENSLMTWLSIIVDSNSYTDFQKMRLIRKVIKDFLKDYLDAFKSIRKLEKNGFSEEKFNQLFEMIEKKSEARLAKVKEDIRLVKEAKQGLEDAAKS